MQKMQIVYDPKAKYLPGQNVPAHGVSSTRSGRRSRRRASNKRGVAVAGTSGSKAGKNSRHAEKQKKSGA